MPFLKLGNRVINTAHITSVELHYEQRAFDPPDLEAEEPQKDREELTADLVRVHFEGSADAITFYHDEAKLLREYFTDTKNVNDLKSDDAKSNVGFG